MTATTVTVGNVADISGPVPGLFQGAPRGVDSYFAYINSQGGVDGRKLELKSTDDTTTCTGNQTATQGLTGSVLAFVGSFSLYDNCGAAVLQSNPGVPNISFGLTQQAKSLANTYSPEPQPIGYIEGPLIYYKDQFPNAVKTVGALPNNSPGSVASWNAQKADMESLGYHIAYERLYGATETDFTSDVIRMRNAGVQFLWLTDTDPATQARILSAAAQQHWRPQVLAGGNSYDPNFKKLVDPTTDDGLLNEQQNALYLGEDRATVPGVDLFLTWLNKTHPGFEPDIFTLFGWSSAMLFVQALKAAGAKPTQAGVLTALKDIHSFDADGLLATSDPGAKKPPTCWIMVKIEAGKYVRLTPDKGFQCQPGGFFNYTGS